MRLVILYICHANYKENIASTNNIAVVVSAEKAPCKLASDLCWWNTMTYMRVCHIYNWIHTHGVPLEQTSIMVTRELVYIYR